MMKFQLLQILYALFTNGDKNVREFMRFWDESMENFELFKQEFLRYVSNASSVTQYKNVLNILHCMFETHNLRDCCDIVRSEMITNGGDICCGITCEQMTSHGSPNGSPNGMIKKFVFYISVTDIMVPYTERATEFIHALKDKIHDYEYKKQLACFTTGNVEDHDAKKKFLHTIVNIHSYLRDSDLTLIAAMLRLNSREWNYNVNVNSLAADFVTSYTVPHSDKCDTLVQCIAPFVSDREQKAYIMSFCKDCKMTNPRSGQQLRKMFLRLPDYIGRDDHYLMMTMMYASGIQCHRYRLK